MSIFNDLEFSNLPYVVLCEVERQNNWGSWTDFIFAIKEIDSSFTVTARKYADINVDGPTEQEWITIQSISSIKSPESFLKAISDCEFEIGIDVGWDVLFEQLSILDNSFCESVKLHYYD